MQSLNPKPSTSPCSSAPSPALRWQPCRHVPHLCPLVTTPLGCATNILQASPPHHEAAQPLCMPTVCEPTFGACQPSLAQPCQTFLAPPQRVVQECDHDNGNPGSMQPHHAAALRALPLDGGPVGMHALAGEGHDAVPTPDPPEVPQGAGADPQGAQPLMPRDLQLIPCTWWAQVGYVMAMTPAWRARRWGEGGCAPSLRLMQTRLMRILKGGVLNLRGLGRSCLLISSSSPA